ncbi:DUF3006 family protein [Aquibacillus rhizosphaerae]|uniref:DUF3006 family protein n=1 Tax=Aquibacillus rhizosphaerae TaxID=3051431 RepID=A0ABT7LCB7_9BACI|nr:DUF3006 family protein [Aquibacillus sp. LR5S19]MDL4843079.1 DUF3006 family protein [Aquibacillus sp. LR5S19]
MKGFLDRIENDRHAVIIVEEINQQFVIAKNHLPSGSQIHDWFELSEKDGDIINISLDRKTTEIQKNKTENLINRVRTKNKGSKFKKRG